MPDPFSVPETIFSRITSSRAIPEQSRAALICGPDRPRASGEAGKRGAGMLIVGFLSGKNWIFAQTRFRSTGCFGFDEGKKSVERFLQTIWENAVVVRHLALNGIADRLGNRFGAFELARLTIFQC